MKKIILLLLLVCITVLFLSCTKPSSSIYYKVTGTTPGIRVTYTTPDGEYSGTQSAPFTSATYNFKSGQSVSIQVNNYPYYSATFIVEIYKDGSLFKSGSGSNGDIITVSGTI